MVALIIKSFKPTLKTGTLIAVIDTIIVMISTIYFNDIEVGLYSALAIFLLGKVLDVFLEGIGFAKMLLIISPEWEKISDKISKEIR